MDLRRITLFIVVLLIGCTAATNEPSTEVVVESVVENLDTVWAIDFLPDGTMIFTERKGTVSLFNGTRTIIAELSVAERSESGLAGIAVDPDFTQNSFVYLYYTYIKEGSLVNRVSRFVLHEHELVDETVLLDDIPSARFHDGGRLKFGPDGLLYITTGDATLPSSAFDLDSLAGKILRMNADGSIPADNPFGTYVFSYGHRNPQGIAWSDEGTLYAAEHGPTRNDEVNVIVKGRNYGWPLVQCDTVSNEYENPIRCFSEFTMAPAAIVFHEGAVYVAGLRGSQLRKLHLREGEVVEEEVIVSDLGRIREVVVHDNYLYLGTSNRDGRGLPKKGDDKIVRIALK